MWSLNYYGSQFKCFFFIVIMYELIIKLIIKICYMLEYFGNYIRLHSHVSSYWYENYKNMDLNRAQIIKVIF